jgi:GT2 family glycosyltransferase
MLSAIRAAATPRGFRRLWRKARGIGADRLYELWVREHAPTPSQLLAQRQRSENEHLVITLLTHAADTVAEDTAIGVLEQSYPHWQYIVAAPAGSPLPQRLTADSRVRVVSVPGDATHAAAWKAALGAARGTFAAVLGADDTLTACALYEFARALERSPDADVIYCDEDRFIGGPPRQPARRYAPRFKPDWSPELLLSGNYIGRLCLFRVAAAVAAGGFRGDCPGAEEWDLWLRLSRQGARFRRLPACRYHALGAPLQPSPEDAAKIVEEHCRGLGLEAPVRTSDGRVTWPVRGDPLVSIVIPNRDAASMLRACVRGLLDETSHPRRELVIVDNGSTDPQTLDLYRDLERRHAATIVAFDRAFNFSAACNAGAAAARGDLLLFLNNDIEVLHADWLEELVRWAQRPDIGVVGAKLLYPDRTIQHAGVVFGLGLVGHIFAHAPEHASGVFGSVEFCRNYLAVTGACQMIRREVFDQLGRYDERYRLSFSDVVLCMEARRAGYRIVYTPHARLVHHESYTRKREDSDSDLALLARYLQSTGFTEDPYFHPELDATSCAPAVRPPRDPSPPEVVRDYVARVLSMSALASW